jgi:signal peptidase I
MSKKPLCWIANAFVTLLLITMVILITFSLSSKFSGDSTSKLGSYKMMVVLSGSMSPNFNAGDAIIISSEKRSLYSKGDVITFKDPSNQGKIITHRIIAVQKAGNEPSYLTKGDANASPDSRSVPSTNIIGQQKWHIPYYGRIIEFAKTKLGIVLLVFLPGLIFIAGEFKSLTTFLPEKSKNLV